MLYRKLLLAYIQHIDMEEGASFVHSMVPSDYGLTQDEFTILKDLVEPPAITSVYTIYPTAAGMGVSLLTQKQAIATQRKVAATKGRYYESDAAALADYMACPTASYVNKPKGSKDSKC